MTNEEVKGRLESFIDTFNICKEHDNALVAVSISKEDIQAFTQAIKALEQQPCDDCISRQAVLDAIDVKAWEFCDYLIREGRNDEQQPVSHFADNLRECVGEDLPPVTPKEKTGRWISFGVQGEIDGQIIRAFTCSKCGAISIFRVSNGNIVNGDLCPNCGAKMYEPQESEDKE